MKVLRYISLIFASLVAVALCGCSDEGEGLSAPDEVPDELTLTLAVPDFSVVELGTRANEDVSISRLTVLCYSKAGALLSSKSYTTGWNNGGNGKFSITVPIHKQTSSVQVVTNAEIPAGTSDLSTLYTSDATKSVLWGKADLKDLISKTSSTNVIAMVRHNAKVTVSSSASGFSVSKFGVYGTASQGSVAPKGNVIGSMIPNVKAGESYGYNSGLVASTAVVNVFETVKDETVNAAAEQYRTRGRIIIEGRYNGVTGYYVVAFRQRTGSGASETPGSYHYTPLDILRNHHYKVQVKEVRAAGWPTLEQARAAEPDNRLTVLITDINEDINDIIANRDYELGVCDEVRIGCDETVAQVSVVSSKPEVSGQPRISLSDDAEWIRTEGYAIPSPSNAQVSTDRGQYGYKYSLRIPVTANALAESREGVVTVRSGELTRTVRVIQSGRDYRRDSNRKVTMLMNGTSVTGDYFNWVDNSLNGVRPEDFHQEGIARNDGLLFPAVPAYTVVYRIPKLSGDKNPGVSGAPFNLSNQSSYYEITMTAQSSPGISEGTFKVTNSQGITVTYPLHRTGYLHEMKSAYASYQPDGHAVPAGWYYYEVVNVNGKWTLDRNLGASSDKPYLTTNADFRENTGSVGAYLKVSTEKSSDLNNPKTIVSSLGLSRFVIPTRSDIESMGIMSVNMTPQNAYETAYVAQMNARSPSKLSMVFVPHGGYYDGDQLKYESHANLWTRTLVSGNQGFSQTSPEFGYWYQYFDVYTSKTAFSNMRIANGSAGMAPTEWSVFKYMPLRLVWN